MSYENYGLTASGFPAGPWDDYFKIEEDKKLETEEQILTRERLSQLKHMSLLTKITGGAKSSEEIVNLCLKVVDAKILNGAVKRYCHFEKLPTSLVRSSWDKTNFLLIIKQYITGLNINLLPEDNSRLSTLLACIIDNSLDEAVYQRIGYIQSFVLLFNDEKAQLDKEMMRQLLSISRLFLNVIELNSDSFNDRKQHQNLMLRMIEMEKVSPMTSFRGKRYIKNWKLRHLRDITYYAGKAEREIYPLLMRLDLTKTMVEIRNEANEIFYSHLRLI